MFSVKILSPRLLLALVLLAAVGCDQDEIRVYTAPKDPPAHVSHAGHDHDPAAPTVAAESGSAANRAMTWTVPEGWRTLPGERPMRIVTLQAGEGDTALEVSVSAFSGMAGGVVANINRWRRDPAGLGPIAPDELDEHAAAFEEDTVHGWTLRITPENEATHAGMLGAVIEGDPAQTWFLRATGSRAQLDEHEAAFIALARSFRFNPAAAPPQPAAAETPDGGAELQWDLPASWRVMPNASPYVYATLHTGAAPTDAQISITPLRGDGGEMLTNVNMWRHPLGLAPLDDLGEQPIETFAVAGAEASLIEMQSPSHGGITLIVAVVPRGDRTWFFRMIGPTDNVQQQRDAFVSFVQSIRFTDD